MQFISKRGELVNEVSEIIGIKFGRLFEMMLKFDRYPRVYHSSDHILDLCEKILRNHLNKRSLKILLLLAVFHDYIYDPKSKTNEEDSARIFLEHAKENNLDKDMTQIVYDGIMDTKTHIPRNEFSKIFCKYDLSGFDGNFSEVLRLEHKIRKEYDWVDWDVYKIEKVKFLKIYSENEIIKSDEKYLSNILQLIDYIENEKAPNIGIYPGSFNPFHRGHLNILQKAERIFDKVIVAYGQNPEKEKSEREIPEYLKYRQVDSYESSLPAYLITKNYNPTIIRGLRNSTDLQYELDFYRDMQHYYNKDVKIVSIFCDAEYQSISSSSIRFAKDYEDLREKANELKVL